MLPKHMWLALCLSEPACVKVDMILKLTCAYMHAGGAGGWE